MSWGYIGDGDERWSICGSLITRGSGSTPPCRSICAQGSGARWHSFASNEGRTRGTYGTSMVGDERGTERRFLSPDNCRGVRV